ncbi:hypothetical protein [Nonomuraea rubra]|uniref:hypothetical protein n=1 Tax=Nonomuraea rubra TaxID=46180 RepID=UPI0031EF5C3E
MSAGHPGPAAAELAKVVELVRAQRPRTVVIGHGRQAGPVAEAFAQAWDGTVLAVVGWPEEAASWLRQARRFTAGEPEAWVVAGGARGMGRDERAAAAQHGMGAGPDVRVRGDGRGRGDRATWDPGGDARRRR